MGRVASLDSFSRPRPATSWAGGSSGRPHRGTGTARHSVAKLMGGVDPTGTMSRAHPRDPPHPPLRPAGGDLPVPAGRPPRPAEDPLRPRCPPPPPLRAGEGGLLLAHRRAARNQEPAAASGRKPCIDREHLPVKMLAMYRRLKRHTVVFLFGPRGSGKSTWLDKSLEEPPFTPAPRRVYFRSRAGTVSPGSRGAPFGLGGGGRSSTHPRAPQ